MKSSRFIFSEISQKFPIMPFSARALEEKRARLGLVECVNHDLLQPYPVLHEKPGDLVAHIKFTLLLMPNGSDRITSHPLQQLQPTKTIDDNPEIKAWLALGTKTKKKGGGKKKKGRAQIAPIVTLLEVAVTAGDEDEDVPLDLLRSWQNEVGCSSHISLGSACSCTDDFDPETISHACCILLIAK
ncbi:Proliferation-associated protein 2G4 [Musa troglodytarum]|uniref:Proliferation-associated protein 2G4 n=1 Tax=Musa troglodytarum TaxID=320322 RepID=A0A9E7JEN5_9LILI|nr:Proliferation-associated protein 2G4 [Musa troglodytarum]